MPKQAINVGILIYGSNGDIELMISLALGLARAGHRIQMFIISINKRDYSFLNETPGIEIKQHPFPEELVTKEDVEFWAGDLEQAAQLMERRYRLVADAITEQSYLYSHHCDLIISTTYMMEVPCIAEKFSKPYISLRPFAGQVRSAHEPPYFLPCELFPGFSTLEHWDIYESYVNKANKRRMNKFRREHGLAPIQNVTRELVDSSWLNIIAYSNYLYPPKPDWPANHHQCGFFKSPSYIVWDMPKALVEFIDKDEPPIFMTVGTMLEYESDRIGFRSRLAALAKSLSRKVVIHADWPEEKIDNNVYLLHGLISYEKLIPLCALAVHHGGVGTTHIVSELGCPSIIIKYGFEQPFSSKALEDQGPSGGSIWRKSFCEETLREMIENALGNSGLKTRAEEFSVRLQNEDGVAHAVAIIEEAYDLL